MRPCRCPQCAADPAPTYTEDHRHQCEVRFVASLPTRSHREAYLFGQNGVDAKRGRGAVRRIIAGLKLLAVDKLPQAVAPVDNQQELFTA